MFNLFFLKRSVFAASNLVGLNINEQTFIVIEK